MDKRRMQLPCFLRVVLIELSCGGFQTIQKSFSFPEGLQLGPLWPGPAPAGLVRNLVELESRLKSESLLNYENCELTEIRFIVTSLQLSDGPRISDQSLSLDIANMMYIQREITKELHMDRLIDR